MLFISFLVTLLPLIAVLAVIISEDHEYTVGRFPPILCAPNSMMTFYSMAVPVDILCCAGVILLVIVFWIVHKVHTAVRFSLPFIYFTCISSFSIKEQFVKSKMLTYWQVQQKKSFLSYYSITSCLESPLCYTLLFLIVTLQILSLLELAIISFVSQPVILQENVTGIFFNHGA